MAATADQLDLPPLAHSPESFGKRVGISTRAVYVEIASGEIMSFKWGKRRLIPDSEAERIITKRMREASAAFRPHARTPAPAKTSASHADVVAPHSEAAPRTDTDEPVPKVTRQRETKPRRTRAASEPATA